ncbi:MAG: MarR family transcriptional regulator [Robiginitomaculum sp.]|nr:MAG: MarR family transcriptional regulator [Robiginitomaculum sp.]PHQ66202.1 MAG: MarR family transcriptional regulator [Robiginitomaculum sp.]
MGEKITDCACMSLRKSARLIAQFYDLKLQPSGLRATQFTLLGTLKGLGPISITNLANAMGMSRTTLTRNIKILEKSGLTSAEQGKEDARIRMLLLTEEGLAAFQEAYPYWEAAQSSFLNKFGRQNWNMLNEELGGINIALAAS